VRATTSDDTADDGAGAEDTGDEAAGDDTGDPCFDEALAPGAWVHEATVTVGDDGARLFDEVALVTDEG